jgi:hypothetical protein
MARMTPTEIRNTVHTLQAQGHRLRKISRLLALSRNTVRHILRRPDRIVSLNPIPVTKQMGHPPVRAALAGLFADLG